jgi:hypothetical protein
MVDRPISDKQQEQMNEIAKKQGERMRQEKEVAAAAKSADTTPKKPGMLREILANRFGINKEAYDAQYEAWEKTLPENPEAAQSEVTRQTEEEIEEEGMRLVAEFDRKNDELVKMAKERTIDPDIAADAEQQLEGLKGTAEQTAAEAMAKVKEPSLWSRFKKVFEPSAESIAKKEAAAKAREASEKIRLEKLAEKTLADAAKRADDERYKKLTTEDKDTFATIKGFSGSDVERKKQIANYLNMVGKEISDSLRDWLGNPTYLPTNAEVHDPNLIDAETEEETAANVETTPESIVDTEETTTQTTETPAPETEAPTPEAETKYKKGMFLVGQRFFDTISKQILTYHGENADGMMMLSKGNEEPFPVEKDFLPNLKIIVDEEEDENEIVPDMGGFGTSEGSIHDEIPVTSAPETKTEKVAGWNKKEKILTLDNGDEINIGSYGLSAELVNTGNKATTQLNITGKDGAALFTLGIRKEAGGNYAIYTKKGAENKPELVSGDSTTDIKPENLKTKIEKSIKDMLDRIGAQNAEEKTDIKAA